jgi:hypothetical protein
VQTVLSLEQRLPLVEESPNSALIIKFWNKMNIPSLRVMMQETDAEAFRSGFSGQPLYYSARWNEIRELAWKEARRQRLARPDDVRCAGYALDILGIPNEHSEADLDEKGIWTVYWR